MVFCPALGNDEDPGSRFIHKERVGGGGGGGSGSKVMVRGGGLCSSVGFRVSCEVWSFGPLGLAHPALAK